MNSGKLLGNGGFAQRPLDLAIARESQTTPYSFARQLLPCLLRSGTHGKLKTFEVV
jgi:hypothetical protein